MPRKRQFVIPTDIREKETYYVMQDHRAIGASKEAEGAGRIHGQEALLWFHGKEWVMQCK